MARTAIHVRSEPEQKTEHKTDACKDTARQPDSQTDKETDAHTRARQRVLISPFRRLRGGRGARLELPAGLQRGLRGDRRGRRCLHGQVAAAGGGGRRGVHWPGVNTCRYSSVDPKHGRGPRTAVAATFRPSSSSFSLSARSPPPPCVGSAVRLCVCSHEEAERGAERGRCMTRHGEGASADCEAGTDEYTFRGNLVHFDGLYMGRAAHTARRRWIARRNVTSTGRWPSRSVISS